VDATRKRDEVGRIRQRSVQTFGVTLRTQESLSLAFYVAATRTRTHARTHARAHTHTHTHTHTHSTKCTKGNLEMCQQGAWGTVVPRDEGKVKS